ncbi:MAG: hypothetical protein V1721_03450 [Pseudomonadota bacterium]
MTEHVEQKRICDVRFMDLLTKAEDQARYVRREMKEELEAFRRLAPNDSWEDIDTHVAASRDKAHRRELKEVLEEIRDRNPDVPPSAAEVSRAAIWAVASRRAERAIEDSHRLENKFEDYLILNKDKKLVLGDPEKQLLILSDRPKTDIDTIRLTDSPMPSMLPAFYQILAQLVPGNKRRLAMVIGDPGNGKTFMMETVARLLSRKEPIIVDCSGIDLGELLFTTALDLGAGKALQEQINARLEGKDGKKIGEVALARLEGLNELEEVPEELTEDSDIEKWKEKHTYFKKGEDGRFSIDWNGVSTGSQEKISKVIGVLKDVSDLEKFGAASNNLGMNTIYGPAIIADILGCPLILDEYNKAKKGTDAKLHRLTQYKRGEGADTCTVKNQLPDMHNPEMNTYVFDRLKMGFASIWLLTGNKETSDSLTVKMSESAISRLKPIDLKYPLVIDWQHRTEQILMGLPVATLQTLYKDAFPKEGFGKFLLTLRLKKALIEAGIEPDPEDSKNPRTVEELAADNNVSIPPFEEAFLKDWPDNSEKSRIFGEFVDIMSIQTNCNRPEHKPEDDVRDKFGYAIKKSPTFRTLMDILKEAMVIGPCEAPEGTKVKEKTIADFFNEKSRKAEMFKKNDENPVDRYWERVVDITRREVDDRAGDYPELHKKLIQAMTDTGLYGIVLQEGARSEKYRPLVEVQPVDDKLTGAFNKIKKIEKDEEEKKKSLSRTKEKKRLVREDKSKTPKVS